MRPTCSRSPSARSFIDDGRDWSPLRFDCSLRAARRWRFPHDDHGRDWSPLRFDCSLRVALVVTGTVTEFSDDRGLGTVTADDGQAHLFHVIEIADGSRTIEVGQSVSFHLLPRFGRLQAGSVRKV